MMRIRFTLMAMAAVLGCCCTQPANAQGTFQRGDVFVAVSGGTVQWRKPDGTLVQNLTVTGFTNATTTGMAFDKTNSLYVTLFSASNVAVFNNSGTFSGTFGSGYNGSVESIVFDRDGNAYVGAVDGDNDIRKFSPSGTLLTQFDVATGPRGSDWIDLAQDQCTMFYTSEGTVVKRFNVCSNQQLPDLNTTPLPGAAAFALRLLPSGGLLVADAASILRLDANGNVLQSYDAPGQDNWFALNLDPDGKSFWSADFATANVFKFDIATGTVLTSFNTGTGANTVFGLTVNGEITAALLLPSAPGQALPITRLPLHPGCITRDARYWFSHVAGSESNCASLLNAITANGDVLAIGFEGLPQDFRNADNVKDAVDTVIEALGFYWRSPSKTGEDGGTQGQKLRGSKLCKERKRMVPELIAAIANNVLLGTAPLNCTYNNGGTTTNFPEDLIEQAGLASASTDVTQIRTLGALLRKFNSSGLTNDFALGLFECEALDRRTLKNISRDPTTQISCPGRNDFCQTAEALISFPASVSVNLLSYTDTVTSPTCAPGGREAVYKIEPPVAAPGRSFLVETQRSNFNTLLSVWSGPCDSLTAEACNDNFNSTRESQVTFTADGTNTYYIVVEGRGGAYGKTKLKVTSF